MQIFEPLLLGIIKHTMEAADGYEVEVEDLNLGHLDGIMLYRVEFWFPQVGLHILEVDTVFSAFCALSLDPDITWGHPRDLIEDKSCVAVYERNVEFATTTVGSTMHVREVGSQTQDFVEPILTLDDIALACRYTTIAQDLYLRYWFKRVRLTESEVVTLIAGRR